LKRKLVKVVGTPGEKVYNHVVDWLHARAQTVCDIQPRFADITTEAGTSLHGEMKQRFGTNLTPLVVIGIGDDAVAIEGYNPDAMGQVLDGRKNVAGVLRPAERKGGATEGGKDAHAPSRTGAPCRCGCRSTRRPSPPKGKE